MRLDRSTERALCDWLMGIVCLGGGLLFFVLGLMDACGGLR